MLLPTITTQRASLRKVLLLSGALGMLAVTTTEEAVEISSSINFVEPIIDGESVHAWSPDGGRVMLAEFQKSDQLIHLCVYRVATRKKEKCIYFIRHQPDLGIYSIDWTDAYIHVGVGFNEGSVGIYALTVPDWEKPDFKELDMAKFKPLSGDQVRGGPAWDQWERGLFCYGEDERYGIQFVPKGGKPKKYVSGEGPKVTRHYLWYTAYAEDGNFTRDGISRIEKATGKVSKLTTKHIDVSVSPRQDEKAALFIRNGARSSEAALYAYVEGKGVIGPLVLGDKKIEEQLRSIDLSPDGKQALLLSSYAVGPEKLKAVVTIKLLSV